MGHICVSCVCCCMIWIAIIPTKSAFSSKNPNIISTCRSTHNTEALITTAHLQGDHALAPTLSKMWNHSFTDWQSHTVQVFSQYSMSLLWLQNWRIKILLYFMILSGRNCKSCIILIWKQKYNFALFIIWKIIQSWCWIRRNLIASMILIDL